LLTAELDRSRQVAYRWYGLVITSGAWKLHTDPDLNKADIRSDESLDDRRHRILQRLKRCAERQNKTTDVTNVGILYISMMYQFSVLVMVLSA
jgi:hypothetical protein